MCECSEHRLRTLTPACSVAQCEMLGYVSPQWDGAESASIAELFSEMQPASTESGGRLSDGGRMHGAMALMGRRATGSAAGNYRVLIYGWVISCGHILIGIPVTAVCRATQVRTAALVDLKLVSMLPVPGSKYDLCTPLSKMRGAIPSGPSHADTSGPKIRELGHAPPV